MKKITLIILAIAAIMAGSACNRLNNIDERLMSLESTVSELKAQVAAGAVITSFDQTDEGCIFTLSNGQVFKVLNGKNGTDGHDGEAIIADIKIEENFIVLTLLNGEDMRISYQNPLSMVTLNIVPDYADGTVCYFKTEDETGESGYVLYIDVEVTPTKYAKSLADMKKYIHKAIFSPVRTKSSFDKAFSVNPANVKYMSGGQIPFLRMSFDLNIPTVSLLEETPFEVSLSIEDKDGIHGSSTAFVPLSYGEGDIDDPGDEPSEDPSEDPGEDPGDEPSEEQDVEVYGHKVSIIVAGDAEGDIEKSVELVGNEIIIKAGSTGSYPLLCSVEEGATVSSSQSGEVYTFVISNVSKDITAVIGYKVFEKIEVKDADAWSNFANLSAEIIKPEEKFATSNVIMQWRKVSDSQWNDIPNTALSFDGKNRFSYKLTGLDPATAYQYRVQYLSDTAINSNPLGFTTENQTEIYNGGFESWYTNGKVQYPDQKGTSYWDSSNSGSASYIGSISVQETGFKHSGNSCAKLQTKNAIIKLAAGCIFTGKFNGLIGTKGAKLDWGVPFSSRPTHLKGYWSYKPGSINKGSQPSGVGAPSKGGKDACQIFCVLLTQQLHVGGNTSKDNYEKSTSIDWENDPRIIAYGELLKNTSSNGKWEEFTVPLKYHDLTKKPAYMAIVCTSSRWGDYFYGSDSSVLYLDDISFIYSDTPVSK